MDLQNIDEFGNPQATPNASVATPPQAAAPEVDEFGNPYVSPIPAKKAPEAPTAPPKSWYENLWGGLKAFGQDVGPGLKDLAATGASLTAHQYGTPFISQEGMMGLNAEDAANKQRSLAAEQQIDANHVANKDVLGTFAGKTGYAVPAILASLATKGELGPQAFAGAASGFMMPHGTDTSSLGNAVDTAAGNTLGWGIGKGIGAVVNPFKNMMSAAGQKMYGILEREGLTHLLDSAQATGSSVANAWRTGLNAVTNAGQNFYAQQLPKVTEAILRKFTATDLPDVAQNLIRTGQPLSSASPEVLGAIKAGAESTLNTAISKARISLKDNTPVANLNMIDPLHYRAQGQPIGLNDALTAVRDTLVRKMGQGDFTSNPVYNAINTLQTAARNQTGEIPPAVLLAMRLKMSRLYDADAVTREMGGKMGDILDNAIRNTSLDPQAGQMYWQAMRTLSALHPIEKAVTNVNDRAVGGKDLIDPEKLYKALDTVRSTEKTATGGFGTLEEKRMFETAEALQHFMGNRPKDTLGSMIRDNATRTLLSGGIGAGIGALYNSQDRGAGAAAGGLAFAVPALIAAKYGPRFLQSAIYGDTLRPLLIKAGNSPTWDNITGSTIPKAFAAAGSGIGEASNAANAPLPNFLKKAN